MLQMAAKAKRNKAPMSDAHKAALAEGRDQGRAVRRYLEAVEAHRPKRGRKQTPDSIKKQLADIEAKLESADPLTRTWHPHPEFITPECVRGCSRAP